MPDRRRVFIDSNVLLYLLSDDDRKADIAESILICDQHVRVISTQIIGEFANFARRKANLDWTEIRFHLNTFRQACGVETVTDEDQDLAVDIAEQYRLQWWDSQIVATSLRIGADILYSEDMQDGQNIESLQIVNPFAA